MPQLSPAATNVSWLISNFVERVPGVDEAVVVSSDGLLMAMSRGLDRASADRFAAVASGLIGLAYGAAGRFGGGAVHEVIIEMEHAFIFVTGISDGSLLCVITGRGVDIGSIAYEMALFAERAGEVLTPEVREELKVSLVGSE